MNDPTTLSNLLAHVCDELQLTPTAHASATEHYNAVARWLAHEGSPLYELQPRVYAQGSFRTATTTKPLSRAEYDLDLVCEMAGLYWPDFDALTVLELIYERLLDNDRYADKLTRLKRCVRIAYAGQFHLDILPAAPDVPSRGTRIRVPDRKLCAWKASDPKGFSAWYETRGLITELRKDAQIDPVPRLQAASEKTPLQRVTQLVKRNRDIAFSQRPDLAPRSIVLTTLIAQHYGGHAATADALTSVLGRLDELFAQHDTYIEVRNPSNEDEVLSEHWKAAPAAYGAARTWIRNLVNEWNRMAMARDLPERSSGLAALFGDEVVKQGLRKQASEVEALIPRGGLKVTSAASLTAASGIAVRPATFYGK